MIRIGWGMIILKKGCSFLYQYAEGSIIVVSCKGIKGMLLLAMQAQTKLYLDK